MDCVFEYALRSLIAVVMIVGLDEGAATYAKLAFASFIGPRLLVTLIFIDLVTSYLVTSGVTVTIPSTSLDLTPLASVTSMS